MLINKFIKSYVALAFLIGIGACSSSPDVQEFAAGANSAEEVRLLTADMQTAVTNQVDVLSPYSYRQADQALKAAMADQAKGRDTKDILHKVAMGRAQLSRATKTADLSRTNMEEVVAARLAAISAGAPKYFADEFAEVDEHLRLVTTRIEDNDLGDVAQNRGKLQKEYLDVELKAIKHTSLGTARATVAVAIREGAKEYAKQSLAIAEKSIIDSEAFIVANRHQTDAVKLRSQETTKAADHLLKITRASKAGKNITSEETALQLEVEQSKTQDQRDMLRAERTTAKALAKETGGLRSDQAFNQSFEEARAEFTNEEAEVYRQGDRLVIRLRSLEFPVSQSVLRGLNFPLLAKVAKVVKGFENSSVVIEGHTDSDGGKVFNDRLSNGRAQAVSMYLISSDAIGRQNISAVGYGFERPLASNKTAKGKAQNRRVDVVITPEVVVN